MSETRLELQIVAESKAATKALDALIDSLGRVQSAVQKAFTFNTAGNVQSKVKDMFSGMESAAKSTSAKVKKEFEKALNPSVAGGKTKLGGQIEEEAEQTVKTVTSANEQIASSVKKTAEEYATFTSKLDLLQMKYDGLKSKLNEGITSGKFDSEKIANYSLQMQHVQEQIENVKKSAKEDWVSALEKGADKAGDSAKSLKERLKELFATSSGAKKHMGGLISSFARIAKYRFLRAVLKEITEGFKFGFENMYQYAKYVGHSFAPAVDSAKDALFKMKNSIGAALAPAIQMLIPYLVQAVNWFINLLNIVNQFLSLLRGQSTWTRATNASASTLDKVKDSAKGASASVKELKGLLADWDELNIIQQETGGGGGGGGRTKADEDLSKYGLLFEEVDMFDEKVQNLFNKFKTIIGWIQDHMDEIKTIALEIGAAILAWNISKGFGGILGLLAGVAAFALTAKITFDITMLLDNAYLESGEEGYLVANVLETALGAVIAKQIMSQLVGKENAAKAGAISAGVVLTISALADIIAALGHTDVSALSKENLSLAVLSGLKVGATAMWLAKTFGHFGIMQSGLIGVGATGLVLGAEIGLKAVLGTDADLSGITNENIEAILLGSGIFGVGVAALTKTFGKTLGASALKTGLGATIGTGLALAAAIDLKALLSGKVDAEQINEVSARSALLGASSIASYVYTGATQFLKQGTGQAAGTAAAMAIATGLAISAALDIKALLSGEVDDSAITEKAIISTMKLSAALAAFGVGTLKNVSSIGLSGALGVGGAILGTGLMVSAGIGIKAVLDGNVDTEDITGTVIESAIEAIGGSATLGFSIFKGIAGYNTVDAIKAAGWTVYSTMMFVGAGIGIKMVIDSGAIDKGAINEKTIAGIITTAVGVGGGLGSLVHLLGVGAIGALSTGAIAAVATGLVVYGVVSIAIAAKKDGIKWGNQEATYEQIDAYVTSNMFSHEIDIKPTLKLINANITKADEADENVRTALQAVLPTMNVINLGLADKGTYSTLMTDMFGEDGNGGAFKKIQDDINEKKRTITTTLTMVPVIGQTGEDKTSEVLGAGLKALTDIDEYFTNKGNEIGNLLKKGIEGSLDDLGEETLKKLLEEFNETTRAFSEGKLIGKSTSELQTSFSKFFGDGGIKDVRDLTKDSFAELLGVFSNYRKELQDGLEGNYIRTAEAYKGMASFYASRGQKGDDELSKYYIGLYDDLIYSLKSGVVQNKVDELSATGKQILIDSLSGIVTEDSFNGGRVFRFSQFKQFLENGYFKDMKGAITDASVASFKGKDTWKEFLWSAIGLGEFGSNLSSLGINPEDILSPTLLNNMKNEFRKIIIDNFWGTDTADTIIKGLFEDSELGDGEGSGSGGGGGGNVVEYELDIDESSFAEPVPAADMSLLTESVDTAATNVQDAVNKIRAAFQSLNGLAFSFSGDMYSGSYSVTMPTVAMAANGGLFSAGELFIARESGPEMVARMGNKSTVANNNQIVAGIAGGVASGQSEQNALLRQQNDLLRRILEKESTVRLEPSAMLGKVNRRSEEMYARNTGRG